MGKTYRKVPKHELPEDEIENKKVKRVDRKHGKVITTDGFYSHPINDGAEIVLGDKVICFEGVVSPKAKKLAKKAAAKRARRNKIETEE